MSFEDYTEFFDSAETHRRNRENGVAGRYYTLAAYELLGHSELERRHDVIMGIVCLMKSAICYRLDGEERSCANRSQQGILVVEDANDRLYDSAPLHGVANELIGDLRLVGRLGDHAEKYEAARKVYSDYEDESIDWQTEDEFEVGIGPFVHVAKAVDHQFANSDYIRTFSLLARIDAKLEHFEQLLARLDELGSWVWEENTADGEERRR